MERLTQAMLQNHAQGAIRKSFQKQFVQDHSGKFLVIYDHVIMDVKFSNTNRRLGTSLLLSSGVDKYPCHALPDRAGDPCEAIEPLSK